MTIYGKNAKLATIAIAIENWVHHDREHTTEHAATKYEKYF